MEGGRGEVDTLVQRRKTTFHIPIAPLLSFSLFHLPLFHFLRTELADDDDDNDNNNSNANPGLVGYISLSLFHRRMRFLLCDL